MTILERHTHPLWFKKLPGVKKALVTAPSSPAIRRAMEVISNPKRAATHSVVMMRIRVMLDIMDPIDEPVTY